MVFKTRANKPNATDEIRFYFFEKWHSWKGSAPAVSFRRDMSSDFDENFMIPVEKVVKFAETPSIQLLHLSSSFLLFFGNTCCYGSPLSPPIFYWLKSVLSNLTFSSGVVIDLWGLNLCASALEINLDRHENFDEQQNKWDHYERRGDITRRSLKCCFVFILSVTIFCRNFFFVVCYFGSIFHIQTDVDGMRTKNIYAAVLNRT